MAASFPAATRCSRGSWLDAERQIAAKTNVYPAGSPVLVLGGHGDYALAPAGKQNPAEFLEKWKTFQPKTEVRFATLGKFVDALLPGVKAGKIELPTVNGGTRFTFDSFWIQSPKVKTWYRRDEHALQAAETLATIASLKTDYTYPAQDFYHGWLQMLLNMDRNTLWGAAGGMVFENETSWDARDRFQWVEEHSQAATEAAMQEAGGQGRRRGTLQSGEFRADGCSAAEIAARQGVLQDADCQIVGRRDHPLPCRSCRPPSLTGLSKLR